MLSRTGVPIYPAGIRARTYAGGESNPSEIAMGLVFGLLILP
jgi:hypothetical protein